MPFSSHMGAISFTVRGEDKQKEERGREGEGEEENLFRSEGRVSMLWGRPATEPCNIAKGSPVLALEKRKEKEKHVSDMEKK